MKPRNLQKMAQSAAVEPKVSFDQAVEMLRDMIGEDEAQRVEAEVQDEIGSPLTVTTNESQTPKTEPNSIPNR